MAITATNNLMFKKMFSSDENKDILQGLIKDFCGLDPTYEEIHIVNPVTIDSYKRAIDSEETVLRFIESDIAVELRNLNVVVEVQTYRDKHFIARTLHYTFKQYNSNYAVPGKMDISISGSKNKYSSLVPVYSVIVTKEKLFPNDNDAVHTFVLYDTEHQSELDKGWIRMSYLELQKTRITSENRQHWLDFFTTGKASDDAPEYIKKAEEVITLANMTAEERELMELIERAEAKRASEDITVFDDGFEKGIEQGVEQERLRWQDEQQRWQSENEALLARIAELESEQSDT